MAVHDLSSNKSEFKYLQFSSVRPTVTCDAIHDPEICAELNHDISSPCVTLIHSLWNDRIVLEMFHVLLREDVPFSQRSGSIDDASNYSFVFRVCSFESLEH